MKNVRIGVICVLIVFSVCLLPATADPGLHEHIILIWFNFYISTTITTYSKCFVINKVKQHQKIKSTKCTQYKKFVSATYEKRKTCFVSRFQCLRAIYHEIVCFFAWLTYKPYTLKLFSFSSISSRMCSEAMRKTPCTEQLQSAICLSHLKPFELSYNLRI